MKALLVIAMLAACNGFDVPAQPTTGAHPVAHAGTGSSYPLGSTIELDGSASFDPDGTIVDYTWSVVSAPPGTVAIPADLNTSSTTLTPDGVGTYVLQLVVTDNEGNADRSTVRIVATGAILDVDAGPAGAVTWLGNAQLAGTAATLGGRAATLTWTFVSRPPNSAAVITNSTSLSAGFVADATGTYVVELEARVGDETRSDTTTIEATAVGVAMGSNNVAYTYSQHADRIVAARDVGHAEVVLIDPTSGAQSAVNAGAFTPRSIAIDRMHQVVAVGGNGAIATVGIGSQLTVLASRSGTGCTAAHVQIPFNDVVHCFPQDGTLEPISTVYMPTGQVTTTPCPVRFPYVTGSQFHYLYMVDGASSQLYTFDSTATPLTLVAQGSLPGIAPPVIAAGNNQAYAITGNGLIVNIDATLLRDLQIPVSAGTYSQDRYEIAVVSGPKLQIFDGMGQMLKLDVVLPTIGSVVPTPKLLAYSDDEHQLIVVLGTATGDIAYTVPR